MAKVKWIKGYSSRVYFGKYRGYTLFRLYYREEWKNWGITFMVENNLGADTYLVQKRKANEVLNKFLKCIGAKSK